MKSIRSKLWLGMMLMSGMIILLLWLFQIVFLENFYSVLELRDVKQTATRIVEEMNTLDSLNEAVRSVEIANDMDNFMYEKQLSIEIVDASNKVIYQETTGKKADTPNTMKEVVNTAVETSLGGTEFNEKVTHPKFGYEFMIIGLPVYSQDKIQGAMIITLPMASVEDTAEILKKQLLIIIGILFLASAFISFRLSKSFAEPILKISKQAESFSDGKYMERIEDTGHDEIGRLAKRMNEMGQALLRNDMLQKELVANVSHELRTPLTLIRGYAETLRDITGNNPEKREKQLGIIIEESERLSHIVEDILNLSQLQSGTATLEQEPFSLNEMLEKIKEHFELQREARTFEITGVWELTDNLLGDKKRIEQVFYNLISNAFRHTKENQLVEVFVSQQLNKVKIEVRDEGEGIDKEDLEHVFKRYYKGKPVDGEKSNGTGLGLAIVKSILEMHQVAYGVESELGTGTVFWFELYKENYHTSF